MKQLLIALIIFPILPQTVFAQISPQADRALKKMECEVQAVKCELRCMREAQTAFDDVFDIEDPETRAAAIESIRRTERLCLLDCQIEKNNCLNAIR